jgi:uncharacterized protein (DUF2235 family)
MVEGGVFMKRNIVIFSDGTGQYSGILFDENRSNIYKMYRASRCAPDSDIDPAEQVAFYDPGIGTVPLGNDLFLTLWRRFYNLIGQALGIGITKNIVDCYAAIIQLWSYRRIEFSYSDLAVARTRCVV